jgi:monofunctional biosynthetic peptidoglycan transglycosylase
VTSVLTRSGPARPRFRRLLLRGLGSLVIVLLVLPPGLILLYRFVPVPLTPLMAMGALHGDGIEKSWVGYDRLSPNLRRAVIASEDARFCTHHGFDWQAIEDAWSDYEAGERRRGGSTITQQTAKNLIFWPGGGWVRKGLEAYPTVLLELLWPKRRILETYLNIIEWGPALYGAEAASHRFFDRPASDLTPRQAALLAAVLPNPHRWSPARPTAYIRARAATILARMAVAPENCF